MSINCNIVSVHGNAPFDQSLDDSLTTNSSLNSEGADNVDINEFNLET